MNETVSRLVRHCAVRAVAAIATVAAGGAAQSACPSGRAPFGDLGVGMYQCVRANCVLSGRASVDTAHTFNVEPTLWFIGGPARGRLRDGDELVAVEGRPITTRAAGARVAMIRPGERAILTVRRGGRDLTVAIDAVASCERPSIQITSAQAGPPDEVSRRALSGGDERGVLGDSPRGGSLPMEMLDGPARARALGVTEVTAVASVVEGSIAAAAGVRRGDVILTAETVGQGARATVRLTVRRGGRTLELTAPAVGLR